VGRGLRDSFHSSPPTGGLTTDDLCAICAERFLPPDYHVRDDGSGTVWVSLEGSRLSVGLRPITVERRGLEAVFAETDARLSEARV
jgi:hypothetical protein